MSFGCKLLLLIFLGTCFSQVSYATKQWYLGKIAHEETEALEFRSNNDKYTIASTLKYQVNRRQWSARYDILFKLGRHFSSYFFIPLDEISSIKTTEPERDTSVKPSSGRYNFRTNLSMINEYQFLVKGPEGVTLDYLEPIKDVEFLLMEKDSLSIHRLELELSPRESAEVLMSLRIPVTQDLKPAFDRPYSFPSFAHVPELHSFIENAYTKHPEAKFALTMRLFVDTRDGFVHRSFTLAEDKDLHAFHPSKPGFLTRIALGITNGCKFLFSR